MEIKLEGDILTIKTPLNETGVPSKSGKSLIVASTHGYTAVPGSDIRVSLNVIKPKS